MCSERKGEQKMKDKGEWLMNKSKIFVLLSLNDIKCWLLKKIFSKKEECDKTDFKDS